jgi:hypothetical protein
MRREQKCILVIPMWVCVLRQRKGEGEEQSVNVTCSTIKEISMIRGNARAFN